MEKQHKEIILRNYVLLTENLDSSRILSNLIQHKILSVNDGESIAAVETSSGKASKLLSFLMRRGPNAFELFMNALAMSNFSLYEKLGGCITGIKPEERNGNGANNFLRHTVRRITLEFHKNTPDLQAILFIPKSGMDEGINIMDYIRKWTSEDGLQLDIILVFTELLMDENICSKLLSIISKGVIFMAALNQEFLSDSNSLMRMEYFSRHTSMCFRRENAGAFLPIYLKDMKPHFLFSLLKPVKWEKAMIDITHRNCLKKYFYQFFAPQTTTRCNCGK